MILVALIGALAGAGELVSRYPDAPKEACLTGPGLAYIAINAIAAGAALAIGAVLGENRLTAGADGQRAFASGDLLGLMLLSGFGALAFFRTKLFTLRVNDADVGIGPSFVLDVILKATDRAVDRERAEPRGRVVSEIMSPIAAPGSFETAKVLVPSYCFALMQNVTAEEQQRVALEIEALSSTAMSDRAKLLNLGLLLLEIVGTDVLRTAVADLSSEFASFREDLATIDAHLGGLDLDQTSIDLMWLCGEMAKLPDEERAELDLEVQRIRAVPLEPLTQRYLYGLLLIRTFGADLVARAVEAIKGDAAKVA